MFTFKIKIGTFFLGMVDNMRIKKGNERGVVRKPDVNLPVGGSSGHRDENTKKGQFR